MDDTAKKKPTQLDTTLSGDSWGVEEMGAANESAAPTSANPNIQGGLSQTSSEVVGANDPSSTRPAGGETVEGTTVEYSSGTVGSMGSSFSSGATFESAGGSAYAGTGGTSFSGESGGFPGGDVSFTGTGGFPTGAEGGSGFGSESGMTGSTTGEAEIGFAEVNFGEFSGGTSGEVSGGFGDDLGGAGASSGIGAKADAGIEKAAGGLEKASELLRDKAPSSGPVGGTASTVAESLEKGATYLRGQDGDQLVSNLEKMVRQRPMASVAIAAGAGYLLSKIVK